MAHLHTWLSFRHIRDMKTRHQILFISKSRKLVLILKKKKKKKSESSEINLNVQIEIIPIVKYYIGVQVPKMPYFKVIGMVWQYVDKA